MNRAVQYLPVHTGFAPPDFKGLFGGELLAQAVPGGSAYIGHVFNFVRHGCFSKTAYIAQAISSLDGVWNELGRGGISEARLAVEAQVTTDHLLINDFTQLQPGYAASK